MYEIPYNIENEYLTPPESTPITNCSYCRQYMFTGDDSWHIGNDIYCECCIDSFKEEIEEIEHEYAI